MSLSITKSPTLDRLVLAGVIDENAQPTLEAVKDVAPVCTINMRAVEEVNSCGIREWVTFLKRIEVGRKIVLEECSPEIVDQMNLVRSFRSKAEIASVWREYACASCGEQESHLLDAKTHFGGGDLRMPALACRKCAQALEPAVEDDEYFRFSL